MLNTSVLVSSDAETAQQLPKYAMCAAARIGTIASPVNENDPTTATAWAATALLAHAAACVAVPCMSQK